MGCRRNALGLDLGSRREQGRLDGGTQGIATWALQFTGNDPRQSKQRIINATLLGDPVTGRGRKRARRANLFLLAVPMVVAFSIAGILIDFLLGTRAHLLQY